MGLQAGQLAPSFTATTYKGEPIDIESFRGKKVWLGFYRWAACPYCNLRMSEVIERWPEFDEQGITKLAVFQSSPERVERYVGSQNPPFPIIADPELDLYGRYGVYTSWMGMLYPRVVTRALHAFSKGFLPWLALDGPLARVPADFLIDPEGLVWKAYYGDAVTDHIPFGDVREFGEDLCLDMPRASVI